MRGVPVLRSGAWDAVARARETGQRDEGMRSVRMFRVQESSLRERTLSGNVRGRSSAEPLGRASGGGAGTAWATADLKSGRGFLGPPAGRPQFLSHPPPPPPPPPPAPPTA